MTNGRGASGHAWSGAGSGCSYCEAKPAWQHDTRCGSRSITDVAADANPATGAALYDSHGHNGRSGWFTVGGTSLTAPLVAGIIATSGRAENQPAMLHSTATVIQDITGGSNGRCTDYLCKARIGYDGPTGIGVLSHL